MRNSEDALRRAFREGLHKVKEGYQVRTRKW